MESPKRVAFTLAPLEAVPRAARLGASPGHITRGRQLPRRKARHKSRTPKGWFPRKTRGYVDAALQAMPLIPISPPHRYSFRPA